MGVYTWRRDDGLAGHSFARLVQVPSGWLAHGTEVLCAGDGSLTCAFRVELDGAWATRAADVHVVDRSGERSVRLRADADRRWTVNGAGADELTGCVDIDVAATPLTNTFPIRRLAGLAAGQTRTAPVAWVEVPSLRVVRVEQSYRRLGPARWEYSDPDHGAFRLDVDGDGVVTDYAGFAVRVG